MIPIYHERQRAFTLIELMVVVAIIGLLAAIAIPKFSNLVIKAKEAAVKGKLGSLRSAISLYYVNNEGNYPLLGLSFDFTPTLVPLYINEVPVISIPTEPGHPPSNFADSTTVDWKIGSIAYSYFLPAIGPPPKTPLLTVNCTHTDSKGTTWSLW